MSEKHKIQHETSQSHEELVSNEQHEKAEKSRQEALEKAKQEQSEVNLAELREQAKAEAESTDDVTINEAENANEPDGVIGFQNLLKTDAYKQTLKRIQARLTPADRAFSKVVHNKAIDSVSNVGAKTVARPSGLLGGSICAFLGSLGLLYSAKYYGFRYNYLMFFIFFIGGFAIGLLLEVVIWLFVKRKRRF